MENINIVVNQQSRMIKSISKRILGNDGENLQENLVFSFEDEFVDGQARLEYLLEDETSSYLILTKVNETYQIPARSLLLQEGTIYFQLVITEGVDSVSIPIFKSNIFKMKINESLNTVEIEAPEGYASWLELANTKLNQMDNFDIDASKTGSVATVTVTNRLGTEKSVQIRDGYDLDYNWSGTSLGIKREDEQDYEYVNLKGDTGEQGTPGYTPQKGIDYYTSSDKAELESEIEDYVINSSTSAFNRNVTEKTNDFNDNASSKTTAFNNNASSKIGDFDTNASNKTTSFNNNAGSKTSDFNDNASSKTNAFNGNATDKTTAFNNNATDKQGAYDSNATSKTTAFNDNATAKTTAYNENHTAKLEAYNDNADDKIDEFDEHAEELQNEVDYWKTTYNSMAKVTGNGTSITLDDTGNSPMKMELKPSAISQETTTGKNLLENKFSTQTLNGLTFTVNSDKTITINGTANAKTRININNNIKLSSLGLELGDSFAFSGCPAGGSSSLPDIDPYGLWLSGQGTTNIYDTGDGTVNIINQTMLDGYYQANIDIASGVVCNNLTFKPMIEKGTTVTAYEPFTGKIPSPNPSYPQDIHVVSGDNEVTVCGKNLLNANSSYVIAGNVNSDKYIVGNIPKEGIPVYMVSNKTYYVSYNITASTSSNRNTPLFYYEDTNSYFYENSSPNYNTTAGRKIWQFTPANTGIYIFNYWVWYINTDITISNIMISDLTDTTYEPYQGQTLPLNLSDLEYCKIGDYEDEFYLATESDTSLVAGKWYLKKNIGKVVLDGSTESWAYTNEWAPYMRYGLSIPNAKMKGDIYSQGQLSNYFTYDAMSTLSPTATHNLGTFAQNQNTTNFYFTTTEATLNDFKSWLSTHNTEVYYLLATPEYILLNDTLQAQLTAIYKRALSYQNQTNISQVNDDLPFVIKASACYDLNKLVERVATLETE